MENASKALLIAGAILLVIAIIAIGVGIVSKTRGVINVAGDQIDAMQVTMHNNQFKDYEGIGISMQTAKELLIIIANNNKNAKADDFKVLVHENIQNSTNDSEKYVANWHYDTDYITNAYAQYKSAYFTGGPITIGDEVNTGSTFNIKMIYNSKGLISRIDFYRHYN